MTFPTFKEGDYVASKSAPDRKMQVETVTPIWRRYSLQLHLLVHGSNKN